MITLMSQSPMIDIDPEDGKEYSYELTFNKMINDDYLYDFTKSEPPIGFNEVGAAYTFNILDHSKTIKLKLDDLRNDIHKICTDPGKYWYYYWKLQNHFTPVTIYCKFNKHDILVYHRSNVEPIPIMTFNKVIKMYDCNEYQRFNLSDPSISGYNPIFEINLWVPHNKMTTDLIDDIRRIIDEYIKYNTTQINRGD